MKNETHLHSEIVEKYIVLCYDSYKHNHDKEANCIA